MRFGSVWTRVRISGTTTSRKNQQFHDVSTNIMQSKHRRTIPAKLQVHSRCNLTLRYMAAPSETIGITTNNSRANRASEAKIRGPRQEWRNLSKTKNFHEISRSQIAQACSNYQKRIWHALLNSYVFNVNYWGLCLFTIPSTEGICCVNAFLASPDVCAPKLSFTQ